MSEIDAPILQMLEGYKSAVLSKDVDAFAALYDEDARIFDMWGQWSYDGIAAWRAMVTDWFGSLGSERVSVDFENTHATSGLDIAVAHAFVTYSALTADGEKVRAMRNRITWGLERKGGGWKIIHEHSSGPLDFATSKLL